MSSSFNGYFCKHQKGGHVLNVILGSAKGGSFLQVATEDGAWQLKGDEGCRLTKRGIDLNLHRPELTLVGRIYYGPLTPIRYDIMGPFAFLPMECRHGVISMKHRLEGEVCLNGKRIDFSGGRGYLEMDSGYSFPSSYFWVQANDFQRPCAIMAAAAEIPLGKWIFTGCICVIHYQGREYRLATYLGARILSCRRDELILKQGRYRLDVRITPGSAHPLSAPDGGCMTRRILEAPSCRGEFTFFENGYPLFHFHSDQTSFEYER